MAYFKNKSPLTAAISLHHLQRHNVEDTKVVECVLNLYSTSNVQNARTT